MKREDFEKANELIQEIKGLDKTINFMEEHEKPLKFIRLGNNKGVRYGYVFEQDNIKGVDIHFDDGLVEVIREYLKTKRDNMQKELDSL